MKLPSLLLMVWLVSGQTVETVAVSAGKIERTSRLPGELAPYLRVSLMARVAGTVESVAVDRGSVVKEGDRLVMLSAPEMKAQIAEAEARVENREAERAEAEAKVAALEATLAGLRKAAETPGAVAANDIVQASKSVDAAKALVSAIEKSIASSRESVRALQQLEQYLTIRAPFAGVITARYVHPGALASPASGALLDLEQVSRLRLIVAVPEADAGAIPSGARVGFTVPAFPGQTFTGVVSRASRSIDARTRTMPVEVDVANAGGALAPGMYADVVWPVRRTRPSLLVPATAVAVTTERVFVIRVKEGKAEWVDVVRGARQGDLVEVRGPLNAGDVVVKRASDELREGSPVR